MNAVWRLVKRFAGANDRLWRVVDTRSQGTFHYIAQHRAWMAMWARESAASVCDLEHPDFEAIAPQCWKRAVQDIAHLRLVTGGRSWRPLVELCPTTRRQGNKKDEAAS
jgi:hypothetical protein